jgi:hypothetical protein
MIKAHVISDLYLLENEWADPIDETMPECDIVFVNGNNGVVKRSILLAETICKKYPEIQVIYLNGRRELIRQKEKTLINDGLTARKFYSDLWPKNLHFAFEKQIHLTIKETKLDILCLHGYPHIPNDDVDVELWKSTSWYRYVNHGLTSDPNYCRPKGISDASRGEFPIWSTPRLCREAHDREHDIIKQWNDLREEGVVKILATSLSPVDDHSLIGIEYTMYPGISVDHWVVGGHQTDMSYSDYHLHGNPGSGLSARTRTFII